MSQSLRFGVVAALHGARGTGIRSFEKTSLASAVEP
jgi:hypothetical protein